MRLSYTFGVLVCLLSSAIILVLGVLNIFGGFSLLFTMLGVWTLVYGLAFQPRNDGILFYAGWGLTLIGLSSLYYLPVRYALSLTLSFILGTVVVNTVLKSVKH
ncbi:hypothetical protein B9Q08_03660 [Candidatus Marsarchaeota G2 archaeon ECH_B_SAG-M15]|uniref:Uncharacterized protein n=1 Tax=Candidatus Marsarchaeota G2 archaeon ECH_B_SAG-M15 TaxID=1978162 RepID=A0A2R6AXG4_9ARCH|nr:MAG: hypothetical protein B9Q08_03660 [Candidatus Marsarchaeota G2 archaeon ECH_B_SAG-M15]